MSRIRVLEIISGFAIEGPLGGIERFGIELVQALDPQQIEPIVCGMWAYNTPYEQDWVTFLKNKNINLFFCFILKKIYRVNVIISKIKVTYYI